MTPGTGLARRGARHGVCGTSAARNVRAAAYRSLRCKPERGDPVALLKNRPSLGLALTIAAEVVLIAAIVLSALTLTH